MFSASEGMVKAWRCFNMGILSRKICGVYKITNLVNGKCYVGQSRNIEWRKQCHMRNYSDTHNGYLSNAINKYGANNFSFEILEECATDQLDELEKKYIKQYNSIKPNGYNIESGGWLLKKISEITKRKIGDALSRPVNQYSILGKYINTFPSAQVITNMTGRKGDRSNIQMVCLGKKKTALGFQWRYAECGNVDIAPVENYRREKNAKVSQYTIDGKYVTTYKNRMEASKKTGITAFNIAVCLQGKSKTAGSFIWKYEESEL
jgi:group I intron endonuclease